MRSRGVVAIAALAVTGAMMLTGCTPSRGMPAAPTDAEVDAAVQSLLDMQWAATGLEGVVERPTLEAERTSDQWSPGMDECVSEMGIASYGWSSTDGFALGSGEQATDAQQLAFYECVARYPAVTVLSHEQRDYIHDYYARTLVPCLGLHGYAMSFLPERDSFVAGTADQDAGWTWSPYAALRQPPMTEEANAELTRECPPTLPGIDGWSSEAG
ncbi:MAG: hypothetical protein JWM50_2365 [Microbacteriaceae bacterium]|nr:hypothetical protein [Microbacteriaceae bacterium]